MRVLSYIHVTHDNPHIAYHLDKLQNSLLNVYPGTQELPVPGSCGGTAFYTAVPAFVRSEGVNYVVSIFDRRDDDLLLAQQFHIDTLIRATRWLIGRTGCFEVASLGQWLCLLKVEWQFSVVDK